jgi:hypothetical protein
MISKQQHKPSIILLQEKLASRSFFSRIRSKLILVPMNTVRTLNYVLVRQCVRDQGGDSGISESQASTQRAAPAAASEVRPEQSGDEAPQLSECRRWRSLRFCVYRHRIPRPPSSLDRHAFVQFGWAVTSFVPNTAKRATGSCLFLKLIEMHGQ